MILGMIFYTMQHLAFIIETEYSSCLYIVLDSTDLGEFANPIIILLILNDGIGALKALNSASYAT